MSIATRSGNRGMDISSRGAVAPRTNGSRCGGGGGPGARVAAAGSCALLSAQLRLHVLRVREVPLERRIGIDQELLQIGVLGGGNERVLHGVDHGLVIGDLRIDVRLV